MTNVAAHVVNARKTALRLDLANTVIVFGFTDDALKYLKRVLNNKWFRFKRISPSLSFS